MARKFGIAGLAGRAAAAGAGQVAAREARPKAKAAATKKQRRLPPSKHAAA